MSARPLNYTTNIPARDTAAECVDLLGEAGADRVHVTYTHREPTGLGFVLDTPAGPREFRLPVDAQAMHKRLQRARREGDFASLHTSSARLNRLLSPEHAANVAWRVCRDWLASVLALIAAEMSSIDDAFVAYRVLPEGSPYKGMTVAEVIRESEQFLALPPGDAP